jgi:hypothetical protein
MNCDKPAAGGDASLPAVLNRFSLPASPGAFQRRKFYVFRSEHGPEIFRLSARERFSGRFILPRVCHWSYRVSHLTLERRNQKGWYSCT